MTGLRIEHIHKRFEKTVALDDISLEIQPGELFFLLGPSGCGKSTLLRIIAGLQEATSGMLYFNDEDVTHRPTQERNAVMCFQSYALWPHLSVAQNVSFGLEVRGMGPAEQKARVAEVLHMVQMEAYAERKPNQLSGGQQQRVALARALAVQPACLLLDEPLSNLDAKLRLEMRAEIRRICKTAGLTTIYVTHDQKEALSIADRIAVLRDGQLVQVGSPADLYYTPVNSFVAQFIGQTNLLPGRIISRDVQTARVETAAGAFSAAAGGLASDKVVVSIRPESIRVGGSRSANSLTGKLVETTFTGEASEHVVEVQGQRLKIVHMPPLFDPPADVTIEIEERDVVLLPEQIMRRFVLLILFVVVLVAPFILQAAMGKRTKAAGTSELKLVILNAHHEGIRREFAVAFKAWHLAKYGQRVDIDYRSYGGGSDMLRYLDSSRDTLFKATGTFKIDLVWGGGDYLFDRQLKKDFLEAIQLDPEVMRHAYPQPNLAGVPLYDQAASPKWFGAALSSFGIVYNKDVLRYLGLAEPKSWSDLADPRYRNWIVLADPMRSASAKQVFMIIVERMMLDAHEAGTDENQAWARGMGLLRQIAANARLFTDSSSSVPIVVGNGDVAAGMAIDFYGRSQADAVGDARMGYVEPAGATIINPDPIAVVRGAEHRELATRFIEFVLSDEGQRLWNVRAGAVGGPVQTSLRRLPIVPAVYDDMSNFTDKVNPFVMNIGFAKSGAREKTFGVMGELMQISCIDLLDELRRTRTAILASPRAAELDARLGTFPFDQKEAIRRAELLISLKNAPAEERLKLLRGWTEEFRKEYEELRAAAGGKG